MNGISVVEGYINIFMNDNILNSNGGIYKEEAKAIESGKLVKNYVTTIYIYKEVGDLPCP